MIRRLGYVNLVVAVVLLGVDVALRFADSDFLYVVGLVFVILYHWETLKKLNGLPGNKIYFLAGFLAIPFSGVLILRSLYHFDSAPAPERTTILLVDVALHLTFSVLVLTFIGFTLKLYKR